MLLETASLTSAPIERWSMRLMFEHPVQFQHVGSMLRGAFGNALKSLACTCETEIHSGCLYQQIFEPAPPVNWPVRYHNVPPAYVLTPPLPATQGLRELKFQFTLLGPGVDSRALLWHVWAEAAARGFGPQRLPARLLPDSCVPLAEPRAGVHRVVLQLLSPLLLKRKTAHMRHSVPLGPDQLVLRDLLIALHRRLELTHRLYSIPARLPVLDDWLAQAATIDMKSQLQQIHFARHSSRQQRRVPLQGLMGSIQLHGKMSRDLLAGMVLGQWLHIGGKTALGLGGYRLDLLDNFTVIQGKADT